MYQVAALLNTSNLYLWFRMSFSQQCIKTGLTELATVALQFGKNRKPELETNSMSSSETMSSMNSESDNLLLKMMSQKREEIHSEGYEWMLKSTEAEKQTLEFITIIRESNLKKLKSTKSFWCEHKTSLPILFELANILLNIPSSSAFVERYFSMCGVVCKQRAGNMDPDLIITRSMLKSNLKLLRH